MTKGMAGGLAWEDRGDPRSTPLLLLRPLGGSMALWGPFADELQREHRIVTFDALGSGESPGRPRTSIAALAGDARMVLDARGIATAHVFGISLGGMVATRLALASPERLDSLVLASTSARGLAFERAGLVRGLGFAACLLRHAADAERCLVRRVLSSEFRMEHPLEAERIASRAAEKPSPPVTIAAHAFAALRHDVRHRLPALRRPTLVLAGDCDHLLGPTSGLGLARGIAGAQRATIAGAGHDLTLERPIETAARVLAFLRRRQSNDPGPPSREAKS